MPLLEELPKRREAWLDRTVALGAVAIAVRYHQIDARLVQAARDRGLDVRAWTVNDALDAGRLAGFGVTGLITDVPGQIRAALAPAALAA